MNKKIETLINEFKSLSGISKKTAEKIVWSISNEKIIQLIKSLNSFSFLKKCEICNIKCEFSLCWICKDNSRKKNSICIVKGPMDLINLENKKIFNGIYFVLEEEINPRKGISPDMINLNKLLKYVNKKTEIIIATDFTIEGELTAKFITNILKDKVKKVFRPAIGVPVGSKLDYVDEFSLQSAFKNKIEV